MFKNILGRTVLVFSLLFVTNIYAEQNSTKKEPQATQKNSSSIEAAKKLLKEMNLEQVYKDAVEASTMRLVNANPKFKKVENKIRDFYNKHIGWNAIKDDLVKLYAKYYTAKELEDIANFYKTPTGKKVLKNMPKLSYEGQLITQSKLQPHLDELKKILDSALEEDKKETKKDDNKTNSKK